MGNIQSVHYKLRNVYSVILFLLLVIRILAFMLMSVKCSVQISVFVVYKSVVSTVKKSSYVGCFNFRQ